jgi:amino acid transporter
VPIFWAYAGFEAAVLPASEIQQPQRTLPRGLILGMAIVNHFYLLTSFAVVVALPWQVTAQAPRPLTDAFGAILTGLGLPTRFGVVLMSLGGLVSIVGVYDVVTLSIARLSYAMAMDGLFPAAFARIHPKFGTPFIDLGFQAVSAVVFALLFDLTHLIAISVFFLGLCYLLTSLSALRLLQRAPEQRLHLPALRLLLILAALSSMYLIAQAPLRLIATGGAVMLVGLGVFVWREKSWRQAAAYEAALKRGEHRFERAARRRETWLLQALRRRSMAVPSSERLP